MENKPEIVRLTDIRDTDVTIKTIRQALAKINEAAVLMSQAKAHDVRELHMGDWARAIGHLSNLRMNLRLLTVNTDGSEPRS